ncbi:hypothetical protein BDP27DRAFT_1372938 [Rhodocollybia butyracea]|uniref:Uncharacterized protein n=1 Tax=Rhodocollybia butyracea TaxID=206335 RepID=A0A9P5TWY9_9AGAR|nr:hypothetical protein BDP27DRAFT_1372938 [Rhodocollybia butyracea]
MLLQWVLNCGCLAENALWEFYLYKTGKISSANVESGQVTTEGRGTQYMHPRLRELLLGQVRAETTWCLDNIWQFEQDDKGRWVVQIRKVKRLQRLHERLGRLLDQALEHKDEEKKRAIFEMGQLGRSYDEWANRSQAGPSRIV